MPIDNGLGLPTMDTTPADRQRENEMDMQPYEVREVHGGTQKRYRFANGYGASAVSHHGSYGGDEGLWELGVLGSNGKLTYSTPITDDVIGYLSEAELDGLLTQIAALPVAA